MKKLSIILLPLLITAAVSLTAYADPVTKLIFNTPSGTAATTCYVWGMSDKLAQDSDMHSSFIQTFVPDTTYSRSYSLASSSSYGNYSTVYGSRHLSAIMWSCVSTTATGTSEPVTVYLNNLQNAVLMPYPSGFGGIGVGYQ